MRRHDDSKDLALVGRVETQVGGWFASSRIFAPRRDSKLEVPSRLAVSAAFPFSNLLEK